MFRVRDPQSMSDRHVTATIFLAELAGPIKFIGADPQAEDAWSPAIVNRALHEEIGHPYTYIAETSHMIHLEKPVELAREVASFLGECGIG